VPLQCSRVTPTRSLIHLQRMGKPQQLVRKFELVSNNYLEALYLVLSWCLYRFYAGLFDWIYFLRHGV
jgi:hypothetical protein